MLKHSEEIVEELKTLSRKGVDNNFVKSFLRNYFIESEYKCIMHRLLSIFIDCFQKGETSKYKEFVIAYFRIKKYEFPLPEYQGRVEIYEKFSKLLDNPDLLFFLDILGDYWKDNLPRLEKHQLYDNEQPIAEYII